MIGEKTSPDLSSKGVLRTKERNSTQPPLFEDS